MDPTQLTLAALAFAGSCIAQKCADAGLEAAWGRIAAAYKRWRGTEPAPDDTLEDEAPQPDSTIVTEAEAIFGRSSGLRRARFVEQILRGCHILWVDDHPENNRWERSLLRTLGVHVTSAETTGSALAVLGDERFDLVLSDIARQGISDEGVRALPALSKAAAPARVIFYVAHLARAQPPSGAFGITNDPNELLHLCLDALERDRA